MEFVIQSAKKGTHTVYFDEEDLPIVKRYSWNLFRGRHGFYAQTTIRTNGKGKKTGLHVLIMKPPPGMQVDHRDGNTLNNRRDNLRLATPMQNAQNRRMGIANTLGYKGIFVRDGKFGVQIIANKKSYTGGRFFDTIEEAAMRYNEMAILLHGEFARLNIIPSQKTKNHDG
jgi:hypothetical protein